MRTSIWIAAAGMIALCGSAFAADNEAGARSSLDQLAGRFE